MRQNYLFPEFVGDFFCRYVAGTCHQHQHCNKYEHTVSFHLPKCLVPEEVSNTAPSISGFQTTIVCRGACHAGKETSRRLTSLSNFLKDSPHG